STVIAVDLDGDRKLDLATSNEQSGDVSILLGKGDGTFRTAVSYAAGSSPWSLVSDDFNGDHKPDLGVLNRFSGAVNVLLNKGNGTFDPAIRTGITIDTPYNITTGDFNDDGKLDLAVIAGLGVFVLPGAGNGTFQAAVTEASFQYGMAIAAKDVNGDGW